MDGGSVDGSDHQDASSVDGGDAVDAPRVKRARLGRPPQNVGPYQLFLLLCGVNGYYPEVLRADCWDVSGAERFLVAVGVGRWELCTISDAGRRECFNLDALTQLASKRTSKPHNCVVLYFLQCVVFLDDIQEVTAAQPSVILAAALGESVVGYGKLASEAPRPRQPLSDVLAAWSAEFGPPVLSNVDSFCTGTGVLHNIAHAGWAFFHVVAIGASIRFSKYRSGCAPSIRACLRFASSHAEAIAPLVAGLHRVRPSAQPLLGSLPVDALLDWLEATRTLKNLRDAPSAKRAWAQLFSRAGRVNAIELCEQTEDASYDLLRRSRVRLDVVAMLLWRGVFAALDLTEVDLYLYADGSPQWRGKELYAVSFDLVIRRGQHREVLRRMCPILQLGLRALSAQGKTLATLWMLFLLVGPFPARFVEVLGRVRSITTDLGTERKLAHMADVAPEFWELLGGKKEAIPRRRWLFPLAVQAPGWAHVYDGLLRLGLASLSFFPGFLDSAKALATLLRERSEDIGVELRSAGKVEIAQMLDAVSLPYFAAWRWGSLWDVLKVTVTSVNVASNAYYKPQSYSNKIRYLCHVVAVPRHAVSLYCHVMFCRVLPFHCIDGGSCFWLSDGIFSIS